MNYPKDMFVFSHIKNWLRFKGSAFDFRQFNFGYAALADYLLSFPQDKWEYMTEEAFEFEKTCRIGNIEDIEKILEGLEK